VTNYADIADTEGLWVVIADFGNTTARVVTPLWDQHGYALAAAAGYRQASQMRVTDGGYRQSGYSVHRYDEVIDKKRRSIVNPYALQPIVYGKVAKAS
jgi:hypothetical protein